MDPIQSFESLPRNKKVLVFAGALGVAALLYLYTKKKKESEESSEEQSSEYSPSGVGGSTAEHAEGEGTDEGILSQLQEDQMAEDPYLGGGYGGSAPATASTEANTSNADGTVPSIPTGTTINTGGGPVYAAGSNAAPIAGTEPGSEGASAVTGGGAPVTPHPAKAHLPAKKTAKPAHPKTHKPAHKVAKHSVTHTKKKKVVSHSSATKHSTPTHHTTKRKRG